MTYTYMYLHDWYMYIVKQGEFKGESNDTLVDEIKL